jgi:hypothetical protein
VFIDLTACFAGGQLAVFILGADEICHTEHLTRSVAAALAISTSTLPNGALGLSYSQTIQATGGVGSYQWSVSSGVLPPGLTLGAITGTVTGTPTTAGTFPFTVQVTSGSQSDQRALSIAIGSQQLTGKYSGTFHDPGNFLGHGPSFPAFYWLVQSGNQFYVMAGSATDSAPRPLSPQLSCGHLCTGRFDLAGGGFTFEVRSAVPPHPLVFLWTGTVGGGIMHWLYHGVRCAAFPGPNPQGCDMSFDGVLTLPFPGPAATAVRPDSND